MKKYLITIVKYFKPLYNVYYFIGSYAINILKFFVKPNDKLILFISFGGKKFDDSPRAIYEGMIREKLFDGYDLVWAFQDIEAFEIPRGNIIKTDSLKYYITALKARCWITNSSVERGLNFKGKNTLYFNTRHGTPIKKMGIDISGDNKSFGSKVKSKIDIITSQSKYEADIFSRVFNINIEKFMVCGLPRNDTLVDRTLNTKEKMMRKIGLPLNKKIILYAPTYREYERDGNFNCVMKPPIDFEKWEKTIGDKYIILLRAHYEVSKVLEFKENKDFVYDVSKYPILNDLMLASDVLISDYSSMFFDYSILDRPMLHYTYDYDEYVKKRGMYFDIRSELLGSSDEENLLNLIINLNHEESVEKVRIFRNKYVESYGNATKISLATIYKEINQTGIF